MKRLKQNKLQRLLLTCAPISKLPSNTNYDQSDNVPCCPAGTSWRTPWGRQRRWAAGIPMCTDLLYLLYIYILCQNMQKEPINVNIQLLILKLNFVFLFFLIRNFISEAGYPFLSLSLSLCITVSLSVSTTLSLSVSHLPWYRRTRGCLYCPRRRCRCGPGSRRPWTSFRPRQPTKKGSI